MIVRNCGADEFMRRIEGRKLVCFGAGAHIGNLDIIFRNHNIGRRISYIADNNNALWGTSRTVNGYDIPVRSPQELIEKASNTVVLITAYVNLSSIYKQLNDIPALERTDCYILKLVFHDEWLSLPGNIPLGHRVNKTPVISKVIRYCWFGGKPLPDHHRKNIDSWEKYCPEYEIIEYNDNNYNVEKHHYTKAAAAAGNWARVSDYARLDLLYNYGGIYMDTDVEVIRPLDELLYNSAYIGFHNASANVNSGCGMGAERQFPLIKEIMKCYDNTTNKIEDGTFYLKTNAHCETEVLRGHGLIQNASYQIVDGMAVLPPECLGSVCDIGETVHKTRQTYSIHHYELSWYNEDARASRELLAALHKEAIENEKWIGTQVKV